MKLLLIALSLSITMVGCSTSRIQPSNIDVVSKVIYDPELNVETEGELGQTIISKSNLTSYPSIIISSDISELIKTGAMANSYSGTILIRSGNLRKYIENQDGAFYVDRRSTFTFFAGTIPCDGQVCTAGIFIPKDTQKRPVIFRFDKGEYSFGMLPVEVKKTTDYVWSAGSFKRELVYGGISQKTIMISYREFSDATARPAFSQDLKYDLNESDIIGYRGARFQVIKAGNTVIRYKVLKQLD